MCFNSLFCKEKEYLTLYPTVIFLFSRPPSSYLKKLWEDNAFFYFFLKRKGNFLTLYPAQEIFFLGLFLLILPNYEKKIFFYILFCDKKREFFTLFPSENILFSASSFSFYQTMRQKYFFIFCFVIRKGNIWLSITTTVIYYLVSCSFSFNQEGIFLKFSFLHVTRNYPFSLSLS